MSETFKDAIQDAIWELDKNFKKAHEIANLVKIVREKDASDWHEDADWIEEESKKRATK